MQAIKVEDKALVVLNKVKKEVIKSSDNLKNIKTSFVGELNVYDILNCKSLILELDALKRLEEVYA